MWDAIFHKPFPLGDESELGVERAEMALGVEKNIYSGPEMLTAVGARPKNRAPVAFAALRRCCHDASYPTGARVRQPRWEKTGIRAQFAVDLEKAVQGLLIEAIEILIHAGLLHDENLAP